MIPQEEECPKKELGANKLLRAGQPIEHGIRAAGGTGISAGSITMSACSGLAVPVSLSCLPMLKPCCVPLRHTKQTQCSVVAWLVPDHLYGACCTAGLPGQLLLLHTPLRAPSVLSSSRLSLASQGPVQLHKPHSPAAATLLNLPASTAACVHHDIPGLDGLLCRP